MGGLSFYPLPPLARLANMAENKALKTGCKNSRIEKRITANATANIASLAMLELAEYSEHPILPCGGGIRAALKRWRCNPFSKPLQVRRSGSFSTRRAIAGAEFSRQKRDASPRSVRRFFPKRSAFWQTAAPSGDFSSKQPRKSSTARSLPVLATFCGPHASSSLFCKIADFKTNRLQTRPSRPLPEKAEAEQFQDAMRASLYK